MPIILHPHFLDSEESYAEAEQYWESLFDGIIRSMGWTHRPYMQNRFGDGTPMRDGNPIFNAYVPEVDRAVRIIQEAPEDIEDIASWLNHTEWEDGTSFSELVISLVLTEETEAEALDRIKQWLQEGEHKDLTNS